MRYHYEDPMTPEEENELEDRISGNSAPMKKTETESNIKMIQIGHSSYKYVDSSFAERLERERDEARDFAEWMHELVNWQEGYIEIPWKDK